MKYDIEAIARLIHDVAHKEVKPRAGKNEGVEKANGGGKQTPADLASEHALITGLKKLCPEADCLGEEGVSADSTLMAKLDKPGALFVIDPIDGSRQFDAGTPEYSVMVSLHINGKAQASWIYFPATDDFYIAQKGQGFYGFKNDRIVNRVMPQPKHQPREMTGLFGIKSMMPDSTPQKQVMRSQLGKLQDSAWAAGYDFASLLRGETQVIMWGQAKFNDIKPWEAFLNELGYVMCDLQGNPYNPHQPKAGIIVAPNQSTLGMLLDIYAGRPVTKALNNLPAKPAPK